MTRGATALGERRCEESPVSLDDSARSSTFADHEKPRNGRDLPTEPARDDGSEPHLAIEHHQHRLQVAESGFHLDHEQDVFGGMPREDVDRAALAADLKAHFGLDDPPGADQPRHPVLDQGSMRTVQEPIDRLASPVDADDDAGLERMTNPLDHAESKLLGAAEFEQRDRPSGYAGPRA